MKEKELMLKIKDRFSQERWQHIMGVYKTAVELAARYGVNEEKAAIAALLHDYGKTLKGDELLAKAKEYGLSLTEADYRSPELLHGPIGARMVADELGITDPEILESIAAHTMGSEQMSALDKIIFLADMVEPNRQYPGVEELRKAAFEDLDRALVMGFDRTINYVLAGGKALHPQTSRSRAALLKEKG